MARIIIVSGIQLSTNPRVVKEADTLAAAGNDVEVIGVALEPQLVERDRQLSRGKPWTHTVLFDVSSAAWSDRLELLAARIRLRFWREVHALFGISNPRQLGIAGPEILRYCLQHRADLYIVHNPQPLWVGVELSRRGRVVGVDVEDWYSEMLLPEDRRGYSIESLRRWEKFLLREAAYSTTTSRRLSEALASSYRCAPPAVVYNTFSWGERDAMDGRILDRVNPDLLSLCWFSQVVGRGRGLETLMDALAGVEVPFEIHLRGHCRADYRQQLLARAPKAWKERIHFHAQVPHAELISRVAEHDIGLAAEIPYCRNTQLTVANKLHLYLLAGLAVVASDTDGQREVAAVANGAVTTFEAGNASALAAALNGILADRDKLRVARERALFAAERFFCWERSAPVLLDRVAEALDGRQGAAVSVSLPDYHSSL
ncbi:MAG TPA: glycosyltransferase [Gemmatimonadaceae bacterium]|nr:glycosyltransferase [Gemmatimonadaceae bacterium]